MLITITFWQHMAYGSATILTEPSGSECTWLGVWWRPNSKIYLSTHPLYECGSLTIHHIYCHLIFPTQPIYILICCECMCIPVLNGIQNIFHILYIVNVEFTFFYVLITTQICPYYKCTSILLVFKTISIINKKIYKITKIYTFCWCKSLRAGIYAFTKFIRFVLPIYVYYRHVLSVEC